MNANPVTLPRPMTRGRDARLGDPATQSRGVTLSRPTARGRDVRLDFWRGVCLIDMVLVHLVHQGLSLPGAWPAIFGQWTRFAAGGFIFIAGMSLGAIHLVKARDPERRRAVYGSLWRRAGVLLLVHWAAETAFLLRYPLLAGQPFPDIAGPMRDIFFFRNGSDLLVFYAIMLLAAPVMLELLRRGWGSVLALTSVGVWFLGQRDPYFGAMDIQQTFLVPLWQAIFVAGMFGGMLLPKYDALRWRTKAGIALAATGLAAILSLASDGASIGVDFSLGLAFWKAPLSGGEALRYLAWTAMVITVSDVLWRWLAGRAWVGAVARLGRKSLAVYVAHVFAVAGVVAIAHHAERSPWEHMMWIVPTLAGLWVVAWGMEKLGRLEQAKSQSPRPASGERPGIGWGWAWGLPARVAMVVALAPMVNAAARWRVSPEAGAQSRVVSADGDAGSAQAEAAPMAVEGVEGSI